jgi:hypothetical protein
MHNGGAYDQAQLQPRFDGSNVQARFSKDEVLDAIRSCANGRTRTVG